ncbi:MAG: hypothetical protein JW821_02220 [Deltaproteobacteria bacterium]|nr:hypothetical protein [Deltaproteobacteria bacterium]
MLRTGRPAGWSGKKDGRDWTESMKDREFAGSFTAAMDSRGGFCGIEVIPVAADRTLIRAGKNSG